jgi:5,10-methylenetetrahydromethanopterin reductase
MILFILSKGRTDSTMSSNLFEFGIKVNKENDIYNNINIIKKAENLGFTHCWFTEDYFYPGIFSLASACAIATEKIQIGIGVINPYTRHPILSAMEFGSFDIVANGRGILGYGASNKSWVEKQMGIPYIKPIQTIEESVQIIKSLFNGEEITFNGKIFNVDSVKLCYKPFRCNIPILIGAKGPKALKLTAKIGDGVLLSMMTSKRYVEYVDTILTKELSSEKKEKFKIAAYFIVNISNNRKKAREQVKPLISRFIGIYGFHPIITSSGLKEEEINIFRKALIENNNVDYLVTDRLIDLFSIAGEEAECTEKILSLIKMGVNLPIISEIPGVPVIDTIKSISKCFL